MSGKFSKCKGNFGQNESGKNFGILGSLGLGIRMLKSLIPGIQEGVFAKSVNPNGAADNATGSEFGGVKVGDQIIQVNDKPMENLSHNEVIRFFKKIPRKSIFVLKRKHTSADVNEHRLRSDTVHAAEFSPGIIFFISVILI